MLREGVARTAANLAELREQVAALVGPIDTPHPDGNILGNLRIVAR